MSTQTKLAAGAAMAGIVGASIALHQLTVESGAVLGLSPQMALGLVAVAAWSVPKLARL